MAPLLDIRSLGKAYRTGGRRLEVLKDVTLTIEAGEMVALTGPSGAGKSTFLHLVGAMERPDGGLIRYGGRDLGNLSGTELALFRNESIGFVFQFHHLLPEFTALENAMFPLLLRGVGFHEAEAKAKEILEEVGLAHRVTHQPGELSGGEQQRVAIARALVGRPSLLLADEPTGNLDEKTSGSIHELIVEIHRRYGLTSIIVTHNPALALLCGQRCRMVEGRLQVVD